MTTPDRQPAAESDEPHREGFAISSGVGGLPRIYVSQPPDEASTGASLWRVAVKAARWARRHLPNRHSAPKEKR